VTNKITAPVNVPVLNEDGRPSLEWRSFFRELERREQRTLTAISDTGTYSNAELRDYIIELRDVLINNKAVDE